MQKEGLPANEARRLATVLCLRTGLKRLASGDVWGSFLKIISTSCPALHLFVIITCYKFIPSIGKPCNSFRLRPRCSRTVQTYYTKLEPSCRPSCGGKEQSIRASGLVQRNKRIDQAVVILLQEELVTSQQITAFLLMCRPYQQSLRVFCSTHAPQIIILFYRRHSD